ncbi:MAG: DUF4870 domain-containing protein [Thermoplasmata archaeon]|jgi:uncharacterized membrane protein|nr:DUF4870 domain-containing protein [Thermoplasmata archaeon]
MEKTSLGMEENIEGALCYVLGWVTGIVFYLLEKENKFVRFHAMQSILTFLPLSVIYWLFGWMLWWMPFIGWAISVLIGVLMFILWIVLMIKAYQGEMFKLPIVGDMAEKGF